MRNKNSFPVRNVEALREPNLMFPKYSALQVVKTKGMRDGSPAAGKSLCLMVGVETHRGGLYV